MADNLNLKFGANFRKVLVGLNSFKRSVAVGTKESNKLNLSGEKLGKSFVKGLTQAGAGFAAFTRGVQAGASRIAQSFAQMGARLSSGFRKSFAFKGQLTGFFRAIATLGVRSVTALTRTLSAAGRVGSEFFRILSRVQIEAAKVIAFSTSGVTTAISTIIGLIPGIGTTFKAVSLGLGVAATLGTSAILGLKSAANAARQAIVSSLSSLLDTISSVAEQIADLFGRVLDSILKFAGVATTALLALGAAAYHSATTSQRGFVQLDRNLRRNGSSLREYRREFERFQRAVEDTSTLGQRDILGGLNRAMSLGASPELAQQAVIAAANYAAALEVPFETAMQQVAKTLGGNVGELGESLGGIFAPLRESLGTEGFAEFLRQGGAIAAVLDEFDGAAQAERAANPLAINLRNLKQIVDDIGATLLPIVNRWLTRLHEWLDSFRSIDWSAWAKNLWTTLKDRGLVWLQFLGDGLMIVFREALTFAAVLAQELFTNVGPVLAQSLVGSLRGALGDKAANWLGLPQTNIGGVIEDRVVNLRSGALHDLDRDQRGRATDAIIQAAGELGLDPTRAFAEIRSLDEDARRNVSRRAQQIIAAQDRAETVARTRESFETASQSSNVPGALRHLRWRAGVVTEDALDHGLDPRTFRTEDNQSLDAASEHITSSGVNATAGGRSNRAEEIAASVESSTDSESDDRDARGAILQEQRRANDIQARRLNLEYAQAMTGYQGVR